MEPISELATRVSSHLWLLHELYPREASLTAVLAENWRGELDRRATNDWSLLQLLLDLVPDVSDAQGSGHIAPGTERKSWLRAKLGGTRAVSRAEGPAERAVLAQSAVVRLAARMDCVVQQGMAADVNFAASCRTTTVPDGPALSTAELLTREELFQNVANWLLNCDLSKVRCFADAFLNDARFLMEEEIDRCANAMSKALPHEAEAGIANEWLAKSADEKRDLVLDRYALRELCKQLAVPVPYSIVLSDELDEIARSRLVRLYGEEGDPSKEHPGADARRKCGLPVELAVTSQQAFRSSLFGVALSGGGIRSATFALGLLQGMADRNILPYIDILSTVSGGGYIGSWLISWIKRNGGVDEVQRCLRGAGSNLTLGPGCPARTPASDAPNPPKPLHWVSRNSDPHSDHVRPVRLLRDYSRYLAPQAGFFSADSWTIAATWGRNTSLNLVVLVLFFAAALLLPRLAVFILYHLSNILDQNPDGLKLLLTTLVASVPLLAGCVLIRVRNLNTFRDAPGNIRAKGRVSRGDNDTQVVFGILPCIWIGAFLQLAVLWNSVRSTFAPLPVMAGFAITLAVGLGILGIDINSRSGDSRPDYAPRLRRVGRTLTRPLVFAVTVAFGAVLVYLLYSERSLLVMNTERGLWIAASVGFALVVAWIAAIVLAFVGLLGRELSDESREWWSRLGAWLGLSIGAWLAICAVCFFMPLWGAMLRLKIAAAGISWLAITAAGVKFAFSPRSGRDTGNADQSRLKTAVMNLAPPVFVAGIVAAEAFALFWVIEWLIDSFPRLVDDPIAHQLCCTGTAISLTGMLNNYWQLMYPGSLAPLVLMIACMGACFYIASRVDINEFSMHYFYKNRLVRAYLGASRNRAHRLPNAFTGFDLDDDIRMRRFQYSDPTQARDAVTDCRPSYAGPYPIINTALNITRGEELGIQNRKAESFIFTPLWSGFDFTRRQASVRKTALSEFAFQRTDLFGTPTEGALLGTAMAISGAAFNANAGFHTQPAIAFLLTVFGVRLGWWAGNPRTGKWTQPSPSVGLLYLLKELTANTSTNEDFVLLSDGGHFENMGLYELIRRRCRFIILSDAEEDEKFKLEGIGGAIRKCRDDFGVVINLNLDALQPLGDPAVSRLHYSLGTIIYPGECGCGRLIYIKSSVTGDEPIDVIEFRKRHSEFPHTSTMNQFFDESHFESYRALGHHIASQVFTRDMPALPLAPGQTATGYIESLFEAIDEELAQRLARPSQVAKETIASVMNTDSAKEE